MTDFESLNVSHRNWFAKGNPSVVALLPLELRPYWLPMTRNYELELFGEIYPDLKPGSAGREFMNGAEDGCLTR